MLERCYEIAKTNWKHNLLPHFLVALLLLLLSPLLMGVENLNEIQVGRILEFYICFLGVILLIPIFLPDTNKDIRDLIASKKTSITLVRFIRLTEAVVCLSLLVLGFLIFLKNGNCEFRFWVCFYVAMATCMFLGAMGMLFYSIIDNVALAYMVPFLYYSVSTGSGSKYLKKFTLISFIVSKDSVGNAEDKIYLLIAAVLMIIVSLTIRAKRRN